MKEEVSVPRALGRMCRVFEKKKQPRRKNVIEVRDFNHAYGLEVGWPDAPRARKIVFPGWVLV